MKLNFISFWDRLKNNHINCNPNNFLNMKKNPKKYNIEIIGKNNKISIDNGCIDNASISVIGQGNSVVIEENCNIKNINICIWGNNNTLIINKNCIVHMNLTIHITQNCENGIVSIGKSCSFADTSIYLYDNKASVVGDDCIFAAGTIIQASDGHTIFQKGTEKVLNRCTNVTISDHVWIGTKALILKNSIIQKNSIVGACSIVSGKCKKSNVIIAGVPAKVVKENIDWNVKSTNIFDR